jgi:hypothetical protein
MKRTIKDPTMEQLFAAADSRTKPKSNYAALVYKHIQTFQTPPRVA